MEERRNLTFNSRHNNSRNKLLSNEGPSNSNKYRRQRTNLSQNPNSNSDFVRQRSTLSEQPNPNFNLTHQRSNISEKPNPNFELTHQRSNISEKPNPNLDLELVKRIEFLISQDPRDLLRKLDELRDQLSRSCEISERPNRERQIPVSRRTLSSSSFRRQNPGNEFPDFQNPGIQNPGNHFPVSSSYRSDPSREHEKYRRVRKPPRDNYSQYSNKSRENYNYGYSNSSNSNNSQFGELKSHSRVEENYGFAPVERHLLLGSQDYERRSLNGSVYSADWASQKSESSKRRAKRSFLPLNGASPFAICDACFTLLQIPSGFDFNKGRKLLNFRCANCSEVINVRSEGKTDSSFSVGSSQNWNYNNYDDLRERSRKVYSKDVNPVSLSTEIEEREYDYGHDNKSSGHLEASTSFSHEREVLEHLFNTKEKRKSLVLNEEIEEKMEELERSSDDIKEAVEIESLVNRFVSDKNIHEEKREEFNAINASSDFEKMEEFNAINDGSDLGNDKEEMERSSSVSDRNSIDVALNEDINAFHVECTENKGETINGENVENKVEMDVSSLDEFKGVINGESIENKEEMENYIADVASENESIVNDSEEMERSIKNEMESSIADVASKSEPIVNDSEVMERSIKDEKSQEMERFIKNDSSVKMESKNENSEITEMSIKDENSKEMDRSFKDEISEEMERSIRVDSVNSEEITEEIQRPIRVDSVNSEQMQRPIRVNSVNSEEMERSIRSGSVNSERSIRVDSVNSSSNRGSSRSSLDDEQMAVISKNGDSSFLGGLIKKSFKDFSIFSHSSEGSKCKVFVNGHPISERAVKRAEKKAGPIDPGNYWYDYHAGFWGVMGHECLGIIPPFIREFNHPMPRDCAGGRTGVMVNGRELHRKDLDVLVRRGLSATPARAYAIEMSGKVVDVATGRELKNLGKLAPTIEILKHGFGMLVPQDLS